MKHISFIAMLSVLVLAPAYAADYTVDAVHSWNDAVTAARAASGNPPFVIDINTNVSNGGDSRISKSVIINGNNHTFTGTSIDFTAGNASTALVRDLTLTGGTTGWGVIADTRNGPSPMQSLTLENVKIIDNTRGGLWTFITGGGNIFINGGEMSRNTNANYAGGAIYNNSGANITISGTSFKNNHAGTSDNYNGGAIWSSRNGVITIQDGTSFTGNHALNGGAITFQGTVNISDSTFADNYATSNGGAIYMNGTSNTAALLNITNGVFINNHTTGAQSNGGAIKMDAGALSISGGLFNENKTGMFGGAIYMTGGAISGATFGNLEDKTGNTSGNSGGAVYNNNADLTISSVKMYYNSAGTNGGAIATQNSGISITGNSEFVGNHAASGGAIFNNSGGVLGIDGAIFTENHATNSGGAIQGFDLSVTNSKFTGNYSENSSGGAISNIIVLLDSVEFKDNHADKGMGGAVFVSYTPSYSTAQQIQNSTFSDNSAMLGGAIMAYTPHALNIGGNTKFIDNEAILADGTESGRGGAIYNMAILNLDTAIGDIVFSGNTAAEGADIYNNSDDPNLSPVINITGDAGVLSMDGGIAGIGEINKTGANSFILEDGNDSTRFTGTYRQSAGRTLVYAEKFFGGENYITNSSSLNILNSDTRIENLGLETSGYLDLRETVVETGKEYKPNKVSVGKITSDGTGLVMLETDGTTSDWLEVTGAATGKFGLHIDSIGNTPTMNKIKVVNFTQPGIDDATFELDPRGDIFKIGAYEYDLVMQEDGGHENWYIERNNTLNASAQTAMGIPALHLSVVKAGMNELRKRMGALRNNNENYNLVGAWVRGYGKNLSIDDKAKTDMNLWGLEAGFDIAAKALKGKVYFGLMGGYMSSEDIKIMTKYDVKADGWSKTPSVGAYLTWVHKSGSPNKWFADFTARHFWVHNKINRTDYANGYDVKRKFWAFSGEVGKLFYGLAPDWMNVGTVGDSHISFEPKLELRYGIGEAQDFKTDNGMSGHVEETNAFSTRLMAQVNFLPNGLESSWKPFVELGVYNEWLGKTEMTYAGTELSPSQTSGMGFEASFGANVTISDSTYAYGALTGEFGEIYTSYQLSLGIRTKF